MLTATYTLVALSVEQASIRGSLQALQKILYANFIDRPAISAGQAGFACDALERLYRHSHWRKIDLFLAPAVRRATDAAEALLGELEALTAVAADAVDAV